MELNQAVHNALSQAVQEANGNVVTRYVGVIEMMTQDGSLDQYIMYSPGVRYSDALGMSAVLEEAIRNPRTVRD